MTGACKICVEGAAMLLDRSFLYPVLPRLGAERADHVFGRSHAGRVGAGWEGAADLGRIHFGIHFGDSF
jgi:hypothetical protein